MKTSELQKTVGNEGNSEEIIKALTQNSSLTSTENSASGIVIGSIHPVSVKLEPTDDGFENADKTFSSQSSSTSQVSNQLNVAPTEAIEIKIPTLSTRNINKGLKHSAAKSENSKVVTQETSKRPPPSVNASVICRLSSCSVPCSHAQPTLWDDKGIQTGFAQSDDDNCNVPDVKYNCQFCDIIFSDEVLHSIHMGCHRHNDPFICNVCGEECNGKYTFYTHIMRGHKLS